MAEVQSYLTEIATLRRTTSSQAQEISALREELRILGELHADEKEDFISQTSSTLRDFQLEIHRLETANAELLDERNTLHADLEKRMQQLATAADKYKQLKMGNASLQISDSQWQQKFYDMQSELELQRENFRQQITDLYWETVQEYEAVFVAELQKQQEFFDHQSATVAKRHRDILWKSVLCSQAVVAIVAILIRLAG